MARRERKVASRDRNELAAELEAAAERRPPYWREYFLECARQVRCPDRTSFQGVRLVNKRKGRDDDVS